MRLSCNHFTCRPTPLTSQSWYMSFVCYMIPHLSRAKQLVHDGSSLATACLGYIYMYRDSSHVWVNMDDLCSQRLLFSQCRMALHKHSHELGLDLSNDLILRWLFGFGILIENGYAHSWQMTACRCQYHQDCANAHIATESPVFAGMASLRILAAALREDLTFELAISFDHALSRASRSYKKESSLHVEAHTSQAHTRAGW